MGSIMEEKAPENKAIGWKRFNRAERRMLKKTNPITYENCFKCGAKLRGDPNGRQWCTKNDCQFKLIRGKVPVKKGRH